MPSSNNYDGPLYAPWSAVVEGRGFDPVEHRKMTKTFTQTSDGLYQRQNYKKISNNGDAVVLDNWAQAHEIWWNKAPFLDRIEVLDKQTIHHTKTVHKKVSVNGYYYDFHAAIEKLGGTLKMMTLFTEDWWCISL